MKNKNLVFSILLLNSCSTPSGDPSDVFMSYIGMPLLLAVGFGLLYIIAHIIEFFHGNKNKK